MKQNLTVDQIFKRIGQIKDLVKENRLKNKSSIDEDSRNQKKKQTKKIHQVQKKKQQTTNKKKAQDQVILTKADIVRTVVKLKPYLQQVPQKNKNQFDDFTNDQQNLISQMLMIQNTRLCAKLSQPIKQQQKKYQKKKSGCVFQIVYSQEQIRQKKPDQPLISIDIKKLQNAYAVVTQILQIYLSLADTTPICKIEMAQFQYVQYHSDLQYDYLRIRYTNKTIEQKCWINIGVISKKQFDLFDRMLFLAKQVARTSPGRLFDNKLLYEILERY